VRGIVVVVVPVGAVNEGAVTVAVTAMTDVAVVVPTVRPIAMDVVPLVDGGTLQVTTPVDGATTTPGGPLKMKYVAPETGVGDNETEVPGRTVTEGG
jgi:hypothetical protein